MNLNRRTFLKTSAILSSIYAYGSQNLSIALATEKEDLAIGGNGLFVQPWFEDSFLDLNDELSEAEANGQQLAIIYEQEGCPYCRQMHKVNFAKPSIASYMKKNFRVVQLDLKGSREVTDFSGKTLSEKEFAHRAQVHFTPTISFYPRDKSKVIGKVGRDAEGFRLTGYWKPFHFETVLYFVRSGSYKSENLSTYLSGRLKALQEKGETVKVWD